MLRRRRAAVLLSEQYFLPLDGVSALQEAIISRNASHLVFASETFASSEEILNVDRFSDFYQSLRIRINQAKSFFQTQSISPLRLKITVMFLPDVAEARLTNLEFRSFVVNIGYYSTTSSILESIQGQVGDYLDSGGRYANSGYQHNFNPDMLRTDYFQLTFINTPRNSGGSTLAEHFYLKLDNSKSKRGRSSVFTNGFVHVVDSSEDDSKNDCFFNCLKSALNLHSLNILNLCQKLNIPTGAKIGFNHIQAIIDFMDSQGHGCNIEIYDQKPTYRTVFHEGSNKVAYIDHHTGLTEVLYCITDIKNVKAEIELSNG